MMEILAGSGITGGDEENVDIAIYRDELPAFAEAELERLYANIYSSMPQWRAAGGLAPGTCTYVERRDGIVTRMLLLQPQGHVLRVLNEGIVVDDKFAAQVGVHLFGAFPSVRAISFHAVRSAVRNPGRLHRSYACLEDIVLPLPASPEAYFTTLGNSTRSYIKRYLNKLKRDHPDFRHEVKFAGGIEESELRQVIAMNGLRMQKKGKVQEIDAAELRRILSLSRERGMLSVLKIGGRICAGTINFLVGGNGFLEVIAHDPAYDDYRLGTLCCYLTIEECIRRGTREYHFLWGPQDYKFRLGGVRQELHHLTLYRSALHALLCPHLAMQDAGAKWRRRAQEWMRDARRQGGGWTHAVAQFAGRLRRHGSV